MQFREYRCAAIRKLDVTVLLHGHRVMPAGTEVGHYALQRCASLSFIPDARVGQWGSLSGDTRFFRRVCRGIWAQRHGVDQLAPQVSLLVQNDLGTLKAVQSVNTNQAAPSLFDDSKRIFGGPFPCDVAVRRAKRSGDALVHMKQQNVAERFVLNVRHHKLGAAGCLCFLLGDCR